MTPGARLRPPRAGTAARAARATPSSTGSATSRSPTPRAAVGTSSRTATRSAAPPRRCGTPPARQPSSPRKAGRPSSSSRLLPDPDRRAEGCVLPQLPRRRVRDAHAAVGDCLAEQLRQAGSVDADDAATRPLGELRVGARLDREDPEEGIVVRDEAGRDEVMADRRLPAGRTDGDLAVPLVLAEAVDVDHPPV